MMVSSPAFISVDERFVTFDEYWSITGEPLMAAAKELAQDIENDLVVIFLDKPISLEKYLK